jgi:aminoglycoside phosphotransferase (APT) family kinase protein
VAGDGAGLRSLAAERGRAVFAAAGTGVDVVAKAYEDTAALTYEARVLELARDRGAPVPEVLAFEPGPPAVLVMTRVPGSPLTSAMGEAPAAQAGAALGRVHELPAAPPYSGGQHRWEEFVAWWAEREAATCARLGILSGAEAAAAASRIAAARDLLARRPTVLIHGDLQPDHVVVAAGRLTGLIDFVDAQPGDALLDVAVLTLWDRALTGPVLRGLGLAADGTTALLLDRYQLLRHLAAAAWLYERGHAAESARHAAAARVGLAAPA